MYPLTGKNDMVLDKCPNYNLFIGGFVGLRRKQALQNCNITHIVSVLDWEFQADAPLIQGYQHLHIPVDDVEDENLLEWFPRSNAFIEAALKSKAHHHNRSPSDQPNGVYIHCAMGKSRSATILLAYLLWSSRHQQTGNVAEGESEMVALPGKPLSVIEALQLLRQGRPIAEPNEGFMQQLHMYEDMGCPTTDQELTGHKLYRRWMNKRRVEESVRVMQAPEMEYIIFEDEATEDPGPSNDSKSAHTQEVSPGIRAPDGTDQAKALSHPSTASRSQVSIKCRKCRHILATTAFILEHNPPPHRDPAHDHSPISESSPLPSPQCAHIFLHPLSWMRSVLAEGLMEGRLVCPNKKCGTNIGKFAWTGLRCSCGGWVTPGFGLIRTKVDETVLDKSQSAALTRDASQSTARSSPLQESTPGGIRLPPHLRAKGNL